MYTIKCVDFNNDFDNENADILMTMIFVLIMMTLIVMTMMMTGN